MTIPPVVCGTNRIDSSSFVAVIEIVLVGRCPSWRGVLLSMSYANVANSVDSASDRRVGCMRAVAMAAGAHAE